MSLSPLDLSHKRLLPTPIVGMFVGFHIFRNPSVKALHVLRKANILFFPFTFHDCSFIIFERTGLRVLHQNGFTNFDTGDGLSINEIYNSKLDEATLSILQEVD